MADEIRREGAKATALPYKDAASKTAGSYDRMFGNGQDGQIASPTGRTDGGYIGANPELERNNDVRHPSTKIWVRRDRKPDAYLHTGNG